MSRARNDVVIAAFGEVLRRVRLDAGLSQEQLALEADIDRTFVGKLERAQRQPTICVLFALAEALNTSPEALISEVGGLVNRP